MLLPEKITAAAETAHEQVTAARDEAARFHRERDDALAAARDARTAAGTETAHARQADAGEETRTSEDHEHTIAGKWLLTWANGRQA